METSMPPTTTDASAPASLLHGFRAHAAHRPDQLALADDTGSCTFGELWQASGAFATRLLDAGAGPGTAVGIAMDGSAANVAVLIGAMRTGAAAAPLNLGLAPSELGGYLDLLDPAVIVADPTGAARLPAATEVLALDSHPNGTELAVRLGATGHDAREGAGADQPAGSAALLMPTGGTTGLPKAAILSHRATLLWALSMAGHGRAGSGTELFFLSFFHIGLLTGLLSSLHAGAPVVVQARFDPDGACERILRDGARRLQVVPTHLRRMRESTAFERARHEVRHVRFGGMASAPEFVDELMDELPNAEISTGYGSTEFGPVTLLGHDDLARGRRDGVGRALPGVHLTIVSPDGGPIPIGDEGDVVVRCPWQASGYVGRPEETARTFTTAGVRLADCGRLDDDGWLTLLGRRSDMVITGGENVFPAEIEAVLSSHPDVHEVVVVGVPDPMWGERVEAAIVAKPGVTLTAESVREFARPHLAPYKLPRSVRLLDRIPVTPNNKPDRRALVAESRSEPA
jgi:fatty-acyl-CoA synthase